MLEVDPSRLFARVDERTGFTVEAQYNNTGIHCDICQLTDDSIRRWVRAGIEAGGHSFAEEVVLRLIQIPGLRHFGRGRRAGLPRDAHPD